MSTQDRTERRSSRRAGGWGAWLALALIGAAGPTFIEKCMWGKSAPARATASAQAAAGDAAARRAIARLPIRFEPSDARGQDQPAFVARGLGYSVAIAPTAAHFSLGTTSRTPLDRTHRAD